MIIGIGSDLVDARRIQKTLEQFGIKFLNRVFTEREQARAQKRNRCIETYAKLFAAKEAVSKALGTGLTKGIQWTDIEILREEHQPPKVILHNRAFEILQEKIPPHHDSLIHLSLSDEGHLCQAFVVISAILK